MQKGRPARSCYQGSGMAGSGLRCCRKDMVRGTLSTVLLLKCTTQEGFAEFRYRPGRIFEVVSRYIQYNTSSSNNLVHHA